MYHVTEKNPLLSMRRILYWFSVTA